MSRVINHFDLNLSNLARDMTSALDRLPRGSSSLQDLSSHVDDAVERGWVYSTLMFGDSRVRTGHLLVGILKTAGLRRALEGISKEFAKINLDTLTARFQDIVAGSPEEQLAATDGSQLDRAAAPDADGQMAPAPFGKQEALRTVFRRPHRKSQNRGKSIPLWRVMRRFGRSSTFSCGGGRTIPS